MQVRWGGLRVGPAIESLPKLKDTAAVPFDLIFIDADKQSNADYPSGRSRSPPRNGDVTDNVVRDGEVANAESTDANVRGARRFTELLAAEPRLSATVLQTVGNKGYDGFALAVVLR